MNRNVSGFACLNEIKLSIGILLVDIKNIDNKIPRKLPFQCLKNKQRNSMIINIKEYDILLLKISKIFLKNYRKLTLLLFLFYRN
jgi:hypothetical protein